MSKDTHKVTLWLAWYVDEACKALPGWPLHLKMVYAASEEEAQSEMQHWLEQQGQDRQDLACIVPSPYGLQFPGPEQSEQRVESSTGKRGNGIPGNLCSH